MSYIILIVCITFFFLKAVYYFYKWKQSDKQLKDACELLCTQRELYETKLDNDRDGLIEAYERLRGQYDHLLKSWKEQRAKEEDRVHMGMQYLAQSYTATNRSDIRYILPGPKEKQVMQMVATSARGRDQDV